MAVPFGHGRRAVGLGDDRAFEQFGLLGPQPHRATEVAGTLDEGLLLLHGGDDRRRCVVVELGRARTLDADDVARELDDHALQAQADTKGRDAALAAHLRAPTFPSIPRTPKPPGTRTASTPPRALVAPASVVQVSEATQRILTLASWWKPPARSASVTDR